MRLRRVIVPAIVLIACFNIAATPPDYLVKFPPPETLYLTPDIDTFPALYEGDRTGPFSAWSFTINSLAGLAALDARESEGTSLVWLHSPGIASYTLMLEDILERTGADRVDLPDLESVVRLGMEKGWVKGYILYRADASDRNPYDKIDLADPAYSNSSNVATSLAAPLGGIVVEERAAPVFESLGLDLLLDVRDKDEYWCFNTHKELFSREHLHLLDPKAPHMRDYAVATRSLCVFGVTPHVDRVLAWLEPNAPTLGWNAGDEFTFVDQLSRFAHFTTASNWIMNLPVMSSLRAGHDVAWEALRVNHKSQTDPLALDWPEDIHFTSFVLSDGDNVQWFLGGFANHQNAYWRAENRGAFPFGWTMPVSHLSQVGVSLLAHLARTASANDQALTFPSGYYYPDAYGAAHGTDRDWYADRVGMFAERLGKLEMRVLINIAEDWKSDGAVNAYRTFARQLPNIAGIFAMQYHPYNAGLGAIVWVEDGQGLPVPVVSPRFSIWSGLSRLKHVGPPALIADLINQQPHSGIADSEAHFSWTIVHSWSHFSHADTSEDLLAEEIEQTRPLPRDGLVRNAFEPTWWCVQRLAPHVRVVAPEELLWRMRISLRPRETLDALAAGLMTRADTPPWQQALLSTYRARLAGVSLDTGKARRRAYHWLQAIYLGKVLDISELPEDLGGQDGRG